jgi:hypothetical protein
MDDKKRFLRKNSNKYDTKYRAYCPICGKDRGYQYKTRVDRLCKSCQGKISHSNISDETRQKMSKARIGKEPYNKGQAMTDAQRIKVSVAKKGIVPHNIGQTMSHAQRIKLSCINQGIEIDHFTDFKTELNKQQRNNFIATSKLCLQKANYTCDLYGIRGCILNAHHLDSWHSNEDKRFNLDNLVCLSKQAHNLFHRFYGSKNNTKEQYYDFKRLMQTIIMPSILTSYLF